MPSFKELNEPAPGWTLDKLAHNTEHGYWMVALIRTDNQRPIALIEDSLEEAWTSAVRQAEAYNAAYMTASDRTGPPQA